MMKQWLIPAVVLIAVGGMGLGVGWSVNEWQDGNEAAPVQTPSVQTGPTQAELDAQLCAAALAAAGNAQASTGGGSNIIHVPQVPQEIKDAIGRYCH